MEKDNNYWNDLIIDTLNGSITEEGQTELNNWLSVSDVNRRYFKQLKEIWHSSVINKEELFDYRKGYSLFNIRVKKRESALQTKRHRLIRRAVVAAAISIPFLFLSYFSLLHFTQKSSPVLFSEVSAPRGSKTKTQLPDGTTVWLNAGTTLRYNSDFGIQNRQISLVGEAYLEVSHNEELPLIVSARDMEVKVLGTTFNVHAYHDDESVKVTLLKGSVQLSNKKDPDTIVLKPNETAICQVTTGDIVVSAGSTDPAIGWIKNRILFSGETLQEIARALERHFDVEIEIKDNSIKKNRFVGDFVKNESIEQIFEIMASNQKFRYRITGKKIEVYK